MFKNMFSPDCLKVLSTHFNRNKHMPRCLSEEGRVARQRRDLSCMFCAHGFFRDRHLTAQHALSLECWDNMEIMDDEMRANSNILEPSEENWQRVINEYPRLSSYFQRVSMKHKYFNRPTGIFSILTRKNCAYFLFP